tara:strand:- start:333 stop:524 length:192 start_codon:yes stop_codon:yes gene_type:complete
MNNYIPFANETAKEQLERLEDGMQLTAEEKNEAYHEDKLKQEALYRKRNPHLYGEDGPGLGTP